MSRRFVLILALNSTLLRAALVTRELRIVASAHQKIALLEPEAGELALDPAQVWYTTKRVIAACLDIGRTETHEIAALALVTAPSLTVMSDAQAAPEPLQSWLLHKLTGSTVPLDSDLLPTTFPSIPFDAALPIAAVLGEAEAQNSAADIVASSADLVILGGARQAWDALGTFFK